MLFQLTTEASALDALKRYLPDDRLSVDLSFGEAFWEFPSAESWSVYLELDPRGTRSGGPGKTGLGLCLSLVLSFLLGRLFLSNDGELADELVEPVDCKFQWGPLIDAEGPERARKFSEYLGLKVRVEEAAENVFWLSFTGNLTLVQLLRHFYLLNAALDRTKHSWIEPRELRRLTSEGDVWMKDVGVWEEWRPLLPPPEKPKPAPLPQPLVERVTAELLEGGYSTVAYLGCRDLSPLSRWLEYPQFRKIIVCDADPNQVNRVQRDLNLLPQERTDKLELFQSGWLYLDRRLERAEAIVLTDLEGSVPPTRLGELRTVLFQELAPNLALLVWNCSADFNEFAEELSPQYQVEYYQVEGQPGLGILRK